MTLLFDLLAPLYDRLARVPDVAPLVSALDLPVRGMLLDLGGGTGRVSRALVDLADAVVVCDVSRAMLARARRHGLSVAQGQAERLPFADGAFTRVLLVDALHHFRRQREALAECARVLAPGGRLVVSEPDIARPEVRAIALAERLLFMDSHFLPPGEVAASIAAAGLSPRVERGARLSYWVVADRPAAGDRDV